ncbi:hypothetical protein D1631_05680 [Chryseobacterium nematophagum]|uniref:Uncharacterized protein n=1 Tax=Chryseobacterium nematophagum TaxID=2305228 RepID=A0A3M7TFQ1_9FLAO|nr:hypothetical protein [Chryseobacterium nematophagum]RNA61459.1 hypothetical protein D1631_05680 [Chryseobacterium nematophagum]
MEGSVIQRFVSYLKGIEKVKSQKDFALKIGYKSESAFSQAIKKTPIPKETILKIKNVYPEFDSWIRNLNKEGIEDVENEAPFEKLTIEEKLNVLYRLCMDSFIKDKDKDDIENVHRVLQGLVSKDAHQDKYIIFMRDKLLKLEKSLEIQENLTTQILEIVKDMKSTTH